MLPTWGFLLVGLAAGVLAGFFGVGGGILIIPVLVFFGMPHHAANGTSLVALLLPVGILGVWQYYQAGKIGPDNIKWGLLIAAGLFFGAYAGSKLAVLLPEHVLRRAFAIFLLVVATKLWLTK